METTSSAREHTKNSKTGKDGKVKAANQDKLNGCNELNIRYPSPADQPSFICLCGDMLHMPLMTTAHAIAYAHKFNKSRHTEVFGDMDDMLVAITCVFLACKVTEELRRLSDVIGTGYRILYPLDAPLDLDGEYFKIRSSVVTSELILVRVLNFDLDISLPFNKIQRILSHMDLAKDGILGQHANMLALECIKSVRIYNFYDSTCIALGSVYVALERSSLNVGECAEWVKRTVMQGALGKRKSTDLVDDVGECIQDLYSVLRGNLQSELSVLSV